MGRGAVEGVIPYIIEYVWRYYLVFSFDIFITFIYIFL